MASYRKKKALYEVIGKGQLKPGYDKGLGELHPGSGEKKQPVEEEPTRQSPEAMTGWPKRPKMVQFNAGRVVISMPNQLAIALVLGIILLLLVCFRLGQMTYVRNQETSSPASVASQSQQAAAGRITKAPAASSELAKPTEPVESENGNRIVIQQYSLRAHLVPAGEYYAGLGIETEILEIEDSYYLVTKNKYDNPNREGTDGYRARQRIRELGARYESPEGYETFGKTPFHDAYGMKFDN